MLQCGFKTELGCNVKRPMVPIEEVELTPTDKISLSAKRLEREDIWYKELCTVYTLMI